MNPQQYGTPPQAPVPNPYDFLNTGPQQRRGFSNDPKQRLILSVVFVAVVLILVIVGISIIASLGKKDYTPLFNTLYDQTEIVRIADAGLAKARTPEARQYAATILYVTETEREATIAALKKAGQEVNEKTLNARKDSDNDKLLTNAEQANRYDEKLIELLDSLIISYHKKIASAKSIAETKTEKELIAQLSKNATVISKTVSN